MRRNYLKLILCLLSFLPFTALHAQIETYTLDPGHTYVLWHIDHFGFSSPSGKWMAEGTLSLDEAKPQDSKVNATIHVADVVTGIPKLDTHLKGKDFFDVAQYPDATFVSDKVVMTGKKTAKVYGTLTLHGVSKPVVLNVTLNKMADHPITHKPSVGFTATAQLKRSDFGMNMYLPGLGDQIKLNIEAEANKG